MLREGSTAPIVDGGGAIAQISVRYRRKGTSALWLLGASWSDSPRTVGLSSTAVPTVVTTRPGKVYVDGDGRGLSVLGFAKLGKRKNKSEEGFGRVFIGSRAIVGGRAVHNVGRDVAQSSSCRTPVRAGEETKTTTFSPFLSGRRGTWAVLASAAGLGLGCFWAPLAGLLRQVRSR